MAPRGPCDQHGGGLTIPPQNKMAEEEAKGDRPFRKPAEGEDMGDHPIQ